jgi:signal transduction histidine kinase
MRILDAGVPWTRFALVALVAAAAPVLIALEAGRATRRHRLAADRALRDYAGAAALAFRERLITQLYFPVDRIFDPVFASGAAPAPAVLRHAAAELRSCGSCGPPLDPAFAFRLTLRDSVLSLDGGLLPPQRRAELVARIPPLDGPQLPPRWYTSFVDTLGPAPQVVYLTLRPDRDGGGSVYGFAVALDQVADTVLRPIVRRVGLLPMIMRAPGRNDSLLSVSLLEPRGSRVLELSPRRQPGTYSASIPASRFLGNWTLHVALDPTTAPTYLIGGLPPSRTLPLALLALVTAALVITTVLAARRSQELARLRTDFVAGVSHELRTPIAQIQLFGESLALGRMRSRRDVRDAGRVIVGESRRLLQLVENVILFSRRTPMVPAPPYPAVPLDALVRETVERFAPLAAAVEATVRTVRLDPAVVAADPNAVRQIMLNLLDNAAKYGPRGQTISVGLAVLGDTARLWVEDEGPGIPAADRRRVWEPFVRLPRDVESSTAGSGIGLAIVRALVAQLGGAAGIEAAPGGGTCVVVELANAHPEEQPCAS